MTDHEDLSDRDRGGNDKRCFIFVIGAPGAGKRALSNRLPQDNGFTHISVGDLLRVKMGKESVIARHVENGELLPWEHLFPVLEEAFRDARPGRPIILDGFPRWVAQATCFHKFYDSLSLVLFFSCPKELAKKRVLNRDTGRYGDISEAFEKRYNQFLKMNPDILECYGSRGLDRLVEVGVLCM
ncbi:hypothetical protein VTG60DRAFT_1964 [Thermothelomyces hinnuleus]